MHPRQSTTGVVVFYIEKAIELVSLGRERVIERGGVGFAVHRAMRDEIVVAEKEIENMSGPAKICVESTRRSND